MSFVATYPLPSGAMLTQDSDTGLRQAQSATGEYINLHPPLPTNQLLDPLVFAGAM